MLAIVGDIHGLIQPLEDAAQKAAAKMCSAVIQVGDFGFYPGYYQRCFKDYGKKRRIPGFNSTFEWLPVYAIDGNHENHAWLWSKGHQELNQATNGMLRYVHRGSVLELDGRRIGFLGGAGSIDKSYQVAAGNWSPQEEVTDADVLRLLEQAGNKPIDFLITHCPPQFVIAKHFDHPVGDPGRGVRVRRAFGAPDDWSDPSTQRVEYAWNQLGRPPLYCGHMHESITEGTMLSGFVRILNINEIAYI